MYHATKSLIISTFLDFARAAAVASASSFAAKTSSVPSAKLAS